MGPEAIVTSPHLRKSSSAFSIPSLSRRKTQPACAFRREKTDPEAASTSRRALATAPFLVRNRTPARRYRCPVPLLADPGSDAMRCAALRFRRVLPWPLAAFRLGFRFPPLVRECCSALPPAHPIAPPRPLPARGCPRPANHLSARFSASCKSISRPHTTSHHLRRRQYLRPDPQRSSADSPPAPRRAAPFPTPNCRASFARFPGTATELPVSVRNSAQKFPRPFPQPFGPLVFPSPNPDRTPSALPTGSCPRQ